MQRSERRTNKGFFGFFIFIGVIIAAIILGLHVPAKAGNSIVVALQAGHSPSSPTISGATGNGVHEDIVNEQVTQKLYDILKSRGFQVYLTNKISLYPSTPAVLTSLPSDRKQQDLDKVLETIHMPWIHNSSFTKKADVALTIHHNSTTSSSVNGYEIFYSSYTGTSAVTGREYGKNSTTVTKQKDLANFIDAQFSASGFPYARRSNPYDRENNHLTKYSSVPTVLVEIGYLSNSSDAAKSTNATHQTTVATRLANALSSYADKHPGSSVPAKLESLSTSQNPTYTPAWEITAKVTHPNGVSKVEIAVWSDANGQDDLKWYTFSSAGNNTYKAYFNVRDSHKNDSGLYHIHIYATDSFGNKHCIGTTKTTLLADTTPPTHTGLTTTPTPTYEDPFTVTAKGVSDSQSGVQKVRFAVWSDKNGQDDLKWYDGTQSGSDWSVSVNTANHKNDTGLYHVHAYAYDNRNNQRCLFTTKIETKKDSTPPRLVSNGISMNPSGTTPYAFTASTNITDTEAGVKSVRVAVWSDKNGQDDLKWYSATHTGNNNWQIYTSFLNHKKDTGIYHVHLYADDKAGNSACLAATKINVTGDTVAPTLTNVSPADGASILARTFAVSATGVTDDQAGWSGLGFESGVKNVRFAVWSDKNGQDDLKWYDGTRSGTTWTATINAANHKNDEGLYHIHVYTYDNNGNSACRATRKITMDADLTAPVGSAISVSKSNPEYKFTVGSTVTDAKSSVKTVQFAVWAAKNGQDDLKWYTATHKGEGKYEVEIDYKNHKSYTGIYNIHMYAEDTMGNRACLRTATANVTGDKTAPTFASISAPSITLEKTFAVTAQGVTDVATGYAGYESGVKNVRFAVWSDKNGQDDLKWYDGKKDGSNNWNVSVSIANHKNDIGLYHVHVYTYDNDGNSACRATQKITVDADLVPPVATAINVSKSNPEYKFTIGSTVTDAKNSVKTVQFAVWAAANGQDDLKWYTATHKGGDKYEVEIDYKNHKSYTGAYNIHMYAEDTKGNRACLRTATVNVTGDKTAPTYTGMSYPSTTDDRTFTVTAQGVTDVVAGYAGYESGVKNVRFAVWSNKNSTDDLKWYDGKKDSSNNWSVNVSIANHKNDGGLYLIHAYGYDNNGNSKMLGEARVTATGDYAAPTFIGMNTSSSSPEYKFTVFADVMDSQSGIKNVQFAVWAATNGQDDLKWYTATYKSGNRYEAAIDYKNHKSYTGPYNIHLYAEDNAGNRACLRTFTVNVTGDKTAPTHQSLSVSSEVVTGTNQTFTASAHGVTDVVSGYAGYESGVKTVQAGVWSSINGQDDLKWYNAQLQSNGDWTTTISTANHNNDSGIYHIHFYAEDNKGNRKMLGEKKVTVVNTKIMGASTTNVDQLVRFYTSNVGESTYPAEYTAEGIDLRRFCTIYIEEAAAEGVRAEVAFAQAMLETGWLRFGGQVGKMQFNFAGLGATDGGAAGFDFRTTYGAGEAGLRAGILAHIQHLKCYASTDPLNKTNYDPRWNDAVNKYGRGCAPYVEMLSGKWASSETYGVDLQKMVARVLSS